MACIGRNVKGVIGKAATRVLQGVKLYGKNRKIIFYSVVEIIVLCRGKMWPLSEIVIKVKCVW